MFYLNPIEDLSKSHFHSYMLILGYNSDLIFGMYVNFFIVVL